MTEREERGEIRDRAGRHEGSTSCGRKERKGGEGSELSFSAPECATRSTPISSPPLPVRSSSPMSYSNCIFFLSFLCFNPRVRIIEFEMKLHVYRLSFMNFVRYPPLDFFFLPILCLNDKSMKLKILGKLGLSFTLSISSSLRTFLI